MQPLDLWHRDTANRASIVGVVIESDGAEATVSVTTGTLDEGLLLASFEPRRDRTPTG